MNISLKVTSLAVLIACICACSLAAPGSDLKTMILRRLRSSPDSGESMDDTMGGTGNATDMSISSSEDSMSPNSNDEDASNTEDTDGGAGGGGGTGQNPPGNPEIGPGGVTEAPTAAVETQPEVLTVAIGP